MRKILILSTILAALVCSSRVITPLEAAASSSEPSKVSLEGTRWSVKVTPDEMATKYGEKAFDDVIKFADGKVTMTECLKYGFQPSEYAVNQKGSDWVFQAQQKSEKEGTSVWEGVVQGDHMTGTLTWTKNDGTIRNYRVEGKKSR